MKQNDPREGQKRPGTARSKTAHVDVQNGSLDHMSKKGPEQKTAHKFNFDMSEFQNGP